MHTTKHPLAGRRCVIRAITPGWSAGYLVDGLIVDVIGWSDQLLQDRLDQANTAKSAPYLEAAYAYSHRLAAHANEDLTKFGAVLVTVTASAMATPILVRDDELDPLQYEVGELGREEIRVHRAPIDDQEPAEIPGQTVIEDHIAEADQ